MIHLKINVKKYELETFKENIDKTLNVLLI